MLNTLKLCKNLPSLFMQRKACGLSVGLCFERWSFFSTNARQRAEKDSPMVLASQLFHASTSIRKDMPTLIFLHGLFGSKKNWDSLAKAFAAKGHEVLTIDLRNHGDNAHVDDMDYNMMSEDVKLTLQELHMDCVVMIGHSMGGRVAMNLALTEPDLVDRLVVEDVAPRSKAKGSTLPGISSVFEGYIAALRGVYFDNSLYPSEIREYVGDQLVGIVTDDDVKHFLLSSIEMKTGNDYYEWRFNLKAIEEHFKNISDFPPHDNTFEKPALFLGGELSRYILKDDIPEIKRLFPNAEIQHIDGAGHWIHADKPWDFINSIEKFLIKTYLF